MTNEENAAIQQSQEQSSIPPADANDLVDGNASKGLVAGPLRMSIAGLLVGLCVWQIMPWAYPYFEIPEVPVKNERSPTEDEVRQQELVTVQTELKNLAVLGLVLGALAALVFALVEGISQGAVVRTLAIACVAMVLAAGLGATGGYLSVLFQRAYQTVATLEPVTRAIGTQGIFWLLMASGVGLGVALFAGRASLVVGTVLQAILAAVLFVIIYVPVAAILFPTDNSERTVPDSSGNIAVWAIGAFGLMGLMLGMSRVRAKKATATPSE